MNKLIGKRKKKELNETKSKNRKQSCLGVKQKMTSYFRGRVRIGKRKYLEKSIEEVVVEKEKVESGCKSEVLFLYLHLLAFIYNCVKSLLCVSETLVIEIGNHRWCCR